MKGVGWVRIGLGPQSQRWAAARPDHPLQPQQQQPTPTTTRTPRPAGLVPASNKRSSLLGIDGRTGRQRGRIARWRACIKWWGGGWGGRAGKHAQGSESEKRTRTRPGRPPGPKPLFHGQPLASSVAALHCSRAREAPKRSQQAVGRFVEISSIQRSTPTDGPLAHAAPTTFFLIASVAWVDWARLAAWTGLALPWGAATEHGTV